MAQWIRVTAIPNDLHLDSAPRAQVLLNCDQVVAFKQAGDERVTVWFDMDPHTASIEVAESLEQIELQLGRVPAKDPVAAASAAHAFSQAWPGGS
jgi:hypothetical protein